MLLMLGDLSLRRTGTNGCEDSVVIRWMIDFMMMMTMMRMMTMIDQGGGEHSVGAVWRSCITGDSAVLQSSARGFFTNMLVGS